jgi:hypothetical protein
MSGIYQCPRRGAQFSPERAAEWRYECTERGCRKPRGSFHRLGPQSAGDHEERWYWTRTIHGIRCTPPEALVRSLGAFDNETFL